MAENVFRSIERCIARGDVNGAVSGLRSVEAAVVARGGGRTAEEDDEILRLRRAVLTLAARFATAQGERTLVVPMAATITSATSGSTNSVEFSIPGSEVGALMEIRGLLGFNAFTSESASISGFGNPTGLDRVAIKALNCKIQLTEKEHKRQLLDSTTFRLSSLIGLPGSAPIRFSERSFIPLMPSEIIQMVATLSDTTASVIGGSTDYGVALVLKLYKTKAGVE